ncbi:MAG: hypothetical protein SOZ09_10255 [Eubacteriales bacterium]|nr:hypothetical protein [Clostridiales bacterium]MDY3942353.1 hypothetical protein [Eubacteriales bacterium]
MDHKIFARHPLGNPHRHWRQDNFILSTFSARGSNMRKVIKNCVDAGFTMLELGWATHEQAFEAVQLCEEYGIDLLFQDFTLHGGMQEFISREGELQSMVPLANTLAPWKRTVGVYIWDEPFRPDQLAEARRQADLYEQAAPDKLPFTVAIPSYNTEYTWQNGLFTKYLYDYAKKIDPPVLSLDYYPFGLPGYNDAEQLDTSLLWCDLGLLRKVAQAYRMPLWFYYQAVNLHKYHRFTFPMVRSQMYAGAMYGAKALQEFTAVDAVITEEGNRGPIFEETKRIHAEFRALGNTLMALQSVGVYHSAELLAGSPYLTGLADELTGHDILPQTLPRRCSVGELADAYGHRYFLFLNRDVDVPLDAELPLKKPVRLYTVSRETGEQIFLGDSITSLTLHLSAGDGVLYRMDEVTDAEPYTLEYRIEK